MKIFAQARLALRKKVCNLANAKTLAKTDLGRQRCDEPHIFISEKLRFDFQVRVPAEVMRRDAEWIYI